MTAYDYCSGILPYCYFGQSLYFLLGRSKRNNRLITFSGKNDPLESDPTETAAREGYEETLGCLLDKAAILTRVRKCSAHEILVSRTPRGMPCYTYLIEVPYRKHYTMSFHKTRDFLATMGIRTYFLQEMTDMKWLCARSMFTKIRHSWEKNNILTSSEQWDKILRLVKTDWTTIDSWRIGSRDDSETEETELEALNYPPGLYPGQIRPCPGTS